MNNYNFTEGKLPILFSCRIRLTDEQRQKLKDAYQRALAGYRIPQGAPVNGSKLVVETAASPDKALGIPSFVMSDLLSSRDSLAIGLVLKFQRVLGVEVISRKDLEAASKKYLEYILSEEYVASL